MPNHPPDPLQPRLRPRLSTLQVLGLASQRDEQWSHLRGLQHARLHERVPARALAQLLALGLANALLAGGVVWWKLAAWSILVLAAIINCARLDHALGRGRRRALTRRDLCVHALGASVCGAAWAIPLLLPHHLAGAGTHVALWTLTVMLAAALAITTRAAPLASLLFAAVTGVAGIAGFALHGEWVFATVGCLFLAVSLHGAIEGARSYLAARVAEANLADQEKLVSLLLREFEDQGADWLWQIDTGRRVRGVSPRFARALGQEPAEMEGLPLLQLLAGQAWDTASFPPSLHELARELRDRRSFADLVVQVSVRDTVRWWRLSGAPLTDESGRFTGFRGAASDVTAQRASEQKIAYLARHDALTGLPNRAIVTEALHDSLRAVERRGGRCALLLLDLDRFKAVNDSLGHPVGDKLLMQVATRLRAVIGPDGLCGRLGGDEFAVVLPDACATDPGSLAEAVIQQLSLPYEVDGHRLSIGASVGSAEGPCDGASVELLMRNADLALYRAKSGGRGAHYRYEPELQAEAEQRRILEQSLRHAIARDELQLAFQPVVEAKAEQLKGFEALLRWQSDQHGMIGPERTIPLAEAGRLIVPIGEWVLREACRQATRWPDPLCVSVNLAGAQLLEPGLAGRISQCLSDSGLAPQRLQLEVTERVLLGDPSRTITTLEELRRLGCKIALDDFGTGTSSLGQLRAFRFSTVKIERSFVRGATRGHAEELAVVRAVVAMAQSIGITATAEGVESAEEAVLMRHLGCSRLQGFYYGRPMTAAEALALACRRPPASAVSEQPAAKPIIGESVAA